MLREGFLKARAYRTEWKQYEARLKAAGARGESPVPPRRDLRLETLAEILDGKILVHAHAYRADEMLMLMKLADEFGADDEQLMLAWCQDVADAAGGLLGLRKPRTESETAALKTIAGALDIRNSRQWRAALKS